MFTTKTLVKNFQCLPVAEMPSNAPYAVRKDSEEDAEKRRDARDEFLHSNERWPDLEYPQLNPELLHAYASMLVGQLDDVEYLDASEEEKDFIFETISQKLHELYRHQKVGQMIGASASSEGLHVEELRERAGNQTFEIFGQMDEDRFRYFLANERTFASEAVRNPATTGRVRKLSQELLLSTGDVKPSEDFKFIELEPGVREIILEDFKAIFPKLDDYLSQDIPATVAVEDVLPYFDRALDVMGLLDQGWYSRFTEGTQAEENAASHTIDVGKNRGDFTKARLIPLPFHEAIHGLRLQNAGKQPNPVHRLASRTNLAFEEGFCKTIEGILTGKQIKAGMLYYESLGLQLGLDRGGERRDFRDTFEIVWRRCAIRNKAETTKQIRKAKLEAHTAMLRTTRGNATDARDKSYSDGDQLAKGWLNYIAGLPQDERRRLLASVLSTQCNPTNPDDAELFEDAEILV